MYIPKHFSSDNKKEAIEFMKKYSFATMVSLDKKHPIATHLPFVITTKNKKITLLSHMAKANKQTNNFNKSNVLVVFQEPHAYISPKCYNNKTNVPTWNYYAVHVYGKVEVKNAYSEKIELLEKSIFEYEPNYINQWKNIDNEYKKHMCQHIEVFDVLVYDLEIAKKLSQNKTKTEKENIIKYLKNQNSDNSLAISDMMERL